MMSKQAVTSCTTAEASQALPPKAQISARLSGGQSHFEDVIFNCSINGDGQIIKALDVNGAQANSFVEIVPASLYELRREQLVERLTLGVFEDDRGEFTFCVSATMLNGDRSPYMCDLEGYVIKEEGVFHPCARVPKPVLDEIERGVAAGATKL
jgi:hypothetical protein